MPIKSPWLSLSWVAVLDGYSYPEFRLYKVLSLLDANLELFESEPLPQKSSLSKENLRRCEDGPGSIMKNES
jgi:hypothetical protein